MRVQRLAALPALTILFALTAAIAAVPQRNDDGSVILPQSSTFHVRFTAPNPSYQQEAWRNAITTVNGVPGSSLRIIEDPVSATPLTPVTGDGINSIAVMSTTDWPLYDPQKPFVVSCYGYECDVWFNNVDFNIVGGTGSYTYTRYYDAESLALSAFLMIAARMDNDVRFERILYSHPPYGVGRWQLTLDETTWLQTVFGAPPPSQAITGTVRRNATPIAYAYVCAAPAAGGDDICVSTAASGTYSLRVPAGGSYRVVASPLTTNRAYLFTSPYHANNPANVNFLATAYPAPVAVGAGQTVSGIDFNVSATASMSEPSEQLEPVPITTDGTPVTFNTWPCGNEDTVTFNSTNGTCYAIGTRATGIAGAVGPARLDRSETVVTLKSGSTVLAQNVSRAALDDDPRSLLLFCETTGRTLTLSIGQREPDACGAGFYYDVSVKALGSPPLPTITSPTSAAPRGTAAGLKELFLVAGTGFLPGVTMTVGGQQATVEYVEGCSQSFNCTYIVAETPATLAAGTYSLTVTNPDGHTASSANSFVVVPVQDGSVFDMYWYGVFPLPANIYSAEGMCWGDVDNDGDLDLFRTGDDGIRLLRNNWIGTGAYSFSDYTATAGLPTDSAANPTFSCAFADVDNDGDLDLIVTFNPEATQDSIRLYVNSFSQDGAVHFTEEAVPRGISQPSGNLYSKVFPLDFNNDGWMDFFVASNVPASGQPYRPNRLYQNTGNGNFADTADALVSMGASNHRTSDAIVGDFNNDGWPDLMLFNIAVSGGQNGNALFLLNNGLGGFSDVTPAANINVVCNATTCNCTHGQAADFNNDGRLDFACFYYTKDSTTVPRLYLNDGASGAAHFTDIASAAGFTYPTLPQRFCPTMTILDADLDGDPDIYLGCRQSGASSDEKLDLLLSNNFKESGSVTFRNATTTSGLSSQQNYSSKGRTDVTTAVDWDNDFDDDIFISGQQCQLTTCTPVYDLAWGGVQNNPNFPNSLTYFFTEDSLKVALKGVVSNIHGVGARVRAVRSLGNGISPTVANCRSVVPPVGEEMKRQMVTHGHNQQPYLIQFNWGDPMDPAHAGSVDCLEIFWPSGLRQTLTNLPMHNSITIEESAAITILRMEPNSGPTSGNANVVIRGIGFRPGATVYFGTARVTSTVTVSTDGTTITCQTPQWQPAGAVDVKVTNPDATTDTLEAGYTYTGGSGIETVDPNPSMLVGPVVSSDPAILTTPGRTITGMACDGATQVLLRMQIPTLTNPATAKVRWFITNEYGAQTTDVGNIFPPGSTPGTRTDVTIPVVSYGGHYYSFMLLEAPVDGSTLVGYRTRPMFIKAELCDTATGICAPGAGVASNRSFDPYYAAIVLQHGIYGGIGTFAFRRSLTGGTGIQDDDRFFVCLGDYSRVFTQFEDSHFQRIADGYWHRDIVIKCLQRMREELGIAATRVSIVTHSMGTPVTKLYVNSPGYLRNDNFRKGDIAAFISLDGVHRGAFVMDVAQALLHGPHGEYVKNATNFLGMPLWTGASEDLTTYSPVIRNLPGTGDIGGTGLNIPAHAMYGTGGSDITYELAIAILPEQIQFPFEVLDAAGYDVGEVFGGSVCQHDATIHVSTQQPFADPDQASRLSRDDNVNTKASALHWTVCGEHNTHLTLRELLMGRINASGGCVDCPDWNMSGFPTNVGRPDSDFTQCNPTGLSLASNAAGVSYSYAESPASAPEELNATNPPADADITLLVNKNTGAGAVTGTWTDTANGSNYCVCRALSPGNFDAAYCVASSVRNFTDTGTLNNALRYYYRVFDGASVSCSPAQAGFSFTGISPQAGFPEGGQEVWLTGTGFTAGMQTSVTIGGAPTTCDQPIDANFMRCISPPHTAGVVDVRMNGRTLTGAYTYATTAGGIVVTSPRPGDYVAPGSTITVAVEAIDRFPVTRVVVGASAGNFGKAKSGPPWRVKLTIPQTASGTITLRTTALGGSSNQHLRTAPDVVLNVDLGGIGLTGITIPGPVSVGSNATGQRLSVNGTYSDDVDRSITGAAGITYTVTAPSILTIGSDGVITPLSSGLTDVTTTYQGFTATAKVWVSLPLQLSLKRSDNSVSWPGQIDATAYDVVVGNLNLLRSTGGNFASAGTGCVADSTTATSVTYGTDPTTGNGFYFLVRAVKYGRALSYNEVIDWPGGKQIGNRDTGATQCP